MTQFQHTYRWNRELRVTSTSNEPDPEHAAELREQLEAWLTLPDDELFSAFEHYDVEEAQ